MKNLSHLIASQFPEYVVQEYPDFVSFVELYYRFLEQEKGAHDVLSRYLEYTDIDRTLDEFIQHFEKLVIDGLPVAVAADRRQLIRHAKDLYQTKGSEESYRLLFRFLFAEEIEMHYPKQQMLRLSDGKWVQNNSIKVTITKGNAFDAVSKAIKIKTKNGVINSFIKSVVQESHDVWELFIDKQFGLPIYPGDIVTAKDFEAICIPTVVSVRVLDGGTGFRVGQVFSINGANGVDAKVKVSKVGVDGSIKRLQLINFGRKYQTNFTVALSAEEAESGEVDPYRDYTNGFSEQVFITKVTYWDSTYADQSYCGQMLTAVTENEFIPDNGKSPTTLPAMVAFSVGVLCAYQGEYVAADGFLSDVNVVQDGYLHQDYSYVIKTKQKLEKYAAIVKKLLHPAGAIMFGELQADIEADISDGVEYANVS